MLKSRNVTKEQKQFHDDLCNQVGCIACRLDGRFNDYVSIHHIDGRTKSDAHFLVLPLCGHHHQVGGHGWLTLHINKARFTEYYGSEKDLLKVCIEILLDKKIIIPGRVLEIFGEIEA